MIEAAVTSYDDVPYDSKPLYSTHPDCLATAARLRGLPAASSRSCRVLELGCATGGNLIPMAYTLPGSRFVGVDLSASQIDRAKDQAQRLGLANIDLHAASIAAIDASWGSFDFVICHGVFSWVPPEIQDHILWICRELLTPHGVAYVSYNTYPGWHLRSVVRDLMRFHAARFDDPQTKVQQARSILAFMAESSTGLAGTLAQVLASEAELLKDAPDYYVFHEHLEEANQPLYFHQFIGKARAAGLAYLGEAWHHTQFDNFEPQVQETLQALSTDLIEMEQFADYLTGRTFRRTLLCHAEAPVCHTPDPTVLDQLYLTALAQPASDQPAVASSASASFRLDDGTVASTNIPIMKAALVELYRQWPAAVPFQGLVASAVRDAEIVPESQATTPAVLAALLVRGYLSHLVAIHSEPFQFARKVSDRPRASGVARMLAAERSLVPNLRHRLVGISPTERLVLQAADGTRSLDEIAGEVAPHLVTARPESAPHDSQDRQQVQDALHRLARCALFEA
ncbi:MAG: class I SAM-dependent methyltransferase [Pirellulaceae bacterium]